MGKYYRVYADIYLDAIEKNVDALLSATKEGTRAIAVVKADGYGHGDVAVSKTVYNKVFGYAVATIDEAVNLRENGIDKPILILGFINPDDYSKLVEHDVDATIFDVETATMLSDAAVNAGKKALCHIKVDTGMRRIGLEPNDEGIQIIKEIKALPMIEARGIFTHFAASDELDKTSAHLQLQKFNTFVEQLNKEGITFEYKHCSNSAGIIDMPEANMDLVRLGISLYGMYPSDFVNKENVVLTPALELKSHVSMVKTVAAGEKVSYGGTFITTRPTTLATVSIGYGDGYPRALSSKGYALINGKKAPIVGRVCMDQMMVDATDIGEVNRNDTVTLIGRDGDNYISVEEIAELAGTFNYEFVCDLGKRIPRNYYHNGQFIGSRDYFHEQWTLKLQ